MADKKNQEKVYELTVDTFNDAEVDFVSFVDEPAIELPFHYFGKDADQFTFANVDQEERKVTGPSMVPDKYIKQMDGDGMMYYVYFSQDTVKEISELFIKNDKHKNANVHHMSPVDGVTLVESWIVDDPDNDKANKFGFNSKNITPGTWMTTFKVDNDNFWNKIKSGEVRGFSIEGKFVKKVEQSKFSKEPTEDEKEIDELLSKLKTLLIDDEKGSH